MGHFNRQPIKKICQDSVMGLMLKLVVLGIFAFFAAEACTDVYNSCSRWAKAGFCNKDIYKDYMKRICPKACGYCGAPATTVDPLKTFPPVTGSCGKPDILQGRVIAGENAKKGAWPWQILMLFNGRTMCGGSLIAPQWVVTAAHCVYRREAQAKYFKVRVGEHRTSTTSDGNDHKDIAVEKIITHRSYSSRTIDNDIALMKLATPVQFGKYVKPVCLPNQGENVPVGTECYITGWGKIKHPGNMHHTLQQGKMSVVSKAACTNLNTRKLGLRITDKMVCAGHGGRTRVSGCHGDSGGPFVCKTGSGDRWVLQGAVSWGSGRCDASAGYTVFARVSQFKSWIDQQMANNA